MGLRQNGVDPKLATLKIETPCSEPRSGWRLRAAMEGQRQRPGRTRSHSAHSARDTRLDDIAVGSAGYEEHPSPGQYCQSDTRFDELAKMEKWRLLLS
jgi:hypothetical protein